MVFVVLPLYFLVSENVLLNSLMIVSSPSTDLLFV